jgi:hypothetical protein
LYIRFPFCDMLKSWRHLNSTWTKLSRLHPSARAICDGDTSGLQRRACLHCSLAKVADLRSPRVGWPVRVPGAASRAAVSGNTNDLWIRGLKSPALTKYNTVGATSNPAKTDAPQTLNNAPHAPNRLLSIQTTVRSHNANRMGRNISLRTSAIPLPAPEQNKAAAARPLTFLPLHSSYPFHSE